MTTAAPTSSLTSGGRTSGGKIELPIGRATALAIRIVDVLRNHCEQIAVAGSIRRCKPIVGDIEIVCVPRCVENLIGERGDSLLDPELNELINAGRLTPGRCRGERYAQFGIPAVEGLKLDLFMVAPEAWGVTMTLRTGPADYSKWLVTRRCYGGALPDDARIADGNQLYRGCAWDRRVTFEEGMGEIETDALVEPGEPIDTPTEPDFFDAIGLEWIEPERRQH